MTGATRCCIVGGGPAGAVLALLLARQGVSTALLEARDDFDRAFRGDTVHPSTLEMLDRVVVSAGDPVFLTSAQMPRDEGESEKEHQRERARAPFQF